MKPLDVVIVGAAHPHHPDHVRAVEAHPAARIARVVPVAPGEVPPPRVLGADAIVVSTSSDQHAAVLAGCPVGTPVFVEKPLGRSAAEAVRLAGHPALTATGFFLRRLPALQAVRPHLAAATGLDLQLSHPPMDLPAWVAAPGGFADLAVHLIDLLTWLDPARELQPGRVLLGGGRPDTGGTARFMWGEVPVRLAVSTVTPGGFRLRAATRHEAWTVDEGTLRRAGSVVVDGPAPDAADAVTAFLDAATGGSAAGLPTLHAAASAQEFLEELLQPGESRERLAPRGWHQPSWPH